MTVVSIVEGDGEVAALPVLLRRLGEWLHPALYFNIVAPIRVRRDQFLNREEIFTKQLKLAALKCTSPGWIVIVLDADDDCPVQLAQRIAQRAKAIVPDARLSVVLANREYEAWFIASAETLDGSRGFRLAGELPEADSIRGAKQWISKRIAQGAYHEVLDQPAFSAKIDLSLARQRSRSFEKLCTDWEANVQALIG